MPVLQYFPVPPSLLALACETVSRRVSRLPFLQCGIPVTEELIGVSLECLNTEFSKTLIVRSRQTEPGNATGGLDQCLKYRLSLQESAAVASVITDVFCRSGIAERTEILDKSFHVRREGVRLLPAWRWHNASAPGYPAIPAGKATNPSPEPWMNLCPVCQTGILYCTDGKQLFGIPHVDYYIECTHCGAKFISEGEQFRLVSIAMIRDPRYKKHLNNAYPADIWSAIARGKGFEKPSQGDHASPVQHRDLPEGTFTIMNDGSVGIPIKEQILYFKPVELNFSRGLKENLFTKEQKLLRDVISMPAYASLRAIIEDKYTRYLPLRTGVFLWERKEKHDPVYLEFLNPYGDEKFGSFRMKDNADAERNGLIIVIAEGQIVHTGCCFETFHQCINEELGHVSIRDCFRDGNGIRCRINALLCSRKMRAGLYIHSTTEVEECRRISESLEMCVSQNSSQWQATLQKSRK